MVDNAQYARLYATVPYALPGKGLAFSLATRKVETGSEKLISEGKFFVSQQCVWDPAIVSEDGKIPKRNEPEILKTKAELPAFAQETIVGIRNGKALVTNINYDGTAKFTCSKDIDGAWRVTPLPA